MSGHNSAVSSRKPSSSSSRSLGQSPTGSPGNIQSQRNLTPNGVSTILGAGSASNLKSLNAGWTVWGPSTPSSKRNASVSSAASAHDVSSPQGGHWDDAVGSPHRKDFPHLDSLNSRHRQTGGLSASRMDGRLNGSKSSPFSPKRFENGLAPGAYRGSVASPTIQTYNTTQNHYKNRGYEPAIDNGPVDNDLYSAIRGMAVEDELAVQHHLNSPHFPAVPGHACMPQVRGSPMQPVRPHYGGYPDYGYYNSSAPYAASPALSAMSPTSLYSPISPLTLQHSSVSDVHHQPPVVFYDYGAGSRSNSQIFYPTHQSMMYQPTHSPLLTPQLAAVSPISDNKYFNFQQHPPPQNLMYSPLRSTPSPHSQAYGASLDYRGQVPLVLQGSSVYGHNISPQSLYLYHAGLRQAQGGESRVTAAPVRSAVLDEFRTNKARRWELRDIFNYIVEFSGDQHGSRFIQQKLETASTEEKQIIFDEIVPDNALQLIQDVFGNYVVQKLFEHGTQVQKTLLANTMEGHILSLSLQMYGCRVVQKAIEFVLPEQQVALISELERDVLRCVRDANANHVIQKLFERVSPDRLSFVSAFRGNVYDLASHPYGCRVLQRCFEHIPGDQTRPLLDELHEHTIDLTQNQFGNYVIQFILEHGEAQDRSLVICKIRGQMLQMARHKFASNVCEKALTCADAKTRRSLIDEIMTAKQDGGSPIVSMMKDQYANYVLQRALTVADGDQRDALIQQVRPQLVIMRRHSSAYSKHLVSIERLLEKYSGIPVTSVNY